MDANPGVVDKGVPQLSVPKLALVDKTRIPLDPSGLRALFCNFISSNTAPSCTYTPLRRAGSVDPEARAIDPVMLIMLSFNILKTVSKFSGPGVLTTMSRHRVGSRIQFKPFLPSQFTKGEIKHETI